MSSSQLFRRFARSVQSALERPYSTTGRHTAHGHHPPTAPRRGRVSRIALPATVGLATYAAGSVYPPETISLLFPRPAPPPPDPDSLQALEEQRLLEERLQQLPLLQTLRASTDRDDWYETRPYAALPQIRRNNHLTAGTLHGAGKLGLIPWAWARKDESEAIIVLHAGRALCGHDGIVHGGLLATLADEALGRQAIINLPDKIGVTAKLEINYKKPTKADQFLVIRTRVVSLEGRKAKVAGTIEDIDGQVLVEIGATFVQPRYANLLNNSGVRRSLGEPLQPPAVPEAGKIPVVKA